MKKLIKIDSSHKGMILESDIGYICNYACSYCPPSLHAGGEWIRYDDYMKFVKKVNPSTVILLGGEPTLHPQITSIIKLINEIGATITLVSNGYKNAKWWEEHNELIDDLVFSYHIENEDVDKFIEKVRAITKTRLLIINFPILLDRFDECVELAKKITSSCPDSYVSLKAIVGDGGFIGYTDEQYKIMSSLVSPSVINHKSDWSRSIKTYKHYSDDTVDTVTARQLISNKDFDYNGWKCWKGIDMLKTIPNGDIYKAPCELVNSNEHPIGNLYDLENVNWITEPQICKKKECHCFTALKVIRKEKI